MRDFARHTGDGLEAFAGVIMFTIALAAAIVVGAVFCVAYILAVLLRPWARR